MAQWSKNLPANAGGTEDAGLIPGLGRFLEEEVSNTPVFLPRESHGQRSLAGPSPWCCKRVGHNLATKHQQQKKDYTPLNEQEFILQTDLK